MTTPAPIRAARAAFERLRGEERGFTVVEGVVAALLLVLGGLAVLQVFDASARNNFRAEQSQVINNRLQAELERIQQLPYAEIALTGYPGDSGDANDPRSRVAETQFAVDRDAAPSSLQELVVNGGAIPGSEATVAGGAVDPGPSPFEAGDISGSIYRFVTWAAPDEGGMKRVVVAAKVDEAPVSFERSFQELQTDVPDPEATPDPNPTPPGEEEEGNTVELWLTDTSCDETTRLTPEVPHPAHNTRGLCDDGEQTGATRGAPDLMFTEGPPEIDPAADPPLEDFDFADDVVGSDIPPQEPPPGLTMPWASGDSCLMEPVLRLIDIRRILDGLLDLLNIESKPDALDGVLNLLDGGSDKHRRAHTWLSPKVSGGGGVLTGEGNLDLWTRTVNGTIHPGEVCVSMFIRQTVTVPYGLLGLGRVDIEVDVPVVNTGLLTNQNGVVCQQGLNLTYFRCSMSQWPTEWSKVSIPMDFIGVNSAGQAIPLVLPPDSQVGISLMVKKDGTEPGQGLEFMYDHADFESRLQLQTESLLCLGNC